MASSSADMPAAPFAAQPLRPDMDSFDIESINSVHDLKNSVPFLIAKLEELTMPDKLKDYVCEYLEEATSAYTQARPRICVLGEVGSGKTSLVNAILGAPILPSVPEEDDDGFSVTQKVTEVVNDTDMRPGTYQVTPRMVTYQDWLPIKRTLIQSLKDVEASAVLRQMAQKVLAKACPSLDPDKVAMVSNEDDAFKARFHEALAPKMCHSVEDAQKELATLIHFHNAGDTEEDIVRFVLSQGVVSVRGNFPLLPRDAVFIDLPGLEDTNTLCRELAERYFILHCTHCWFCFAKHENRLKSKVSIDRQIRVLARSGRLKNLILVRTKSDNCPKKHTATLEKEWVQFKELCSSAQDRLNLTATPAQWVSVTTRPATQSDEGELDIESIEKVLAEITSQQQAAARELARVALQKVDGLVSEVGQKTAEQLKTQLMKAEEHVTVFRAKIHSINPYAPTTAVVEEVERAGCIAEGGHWKILEALCNSSSFCYRSSGLQPFDLRQTVLGSLTLAADGSLENAWATLITRMLEHLRSVPDLPDDFRSLFNTKFDSLRGQVNAIYAPRGLIHDLLNIPLHPRELLPGDGYVENVIQQTSSILRAQVGVPDFLERLAEDLCGKALALITDLGALVDRRFLAVAFVDKAAEESDADGPPKPKKSKSNESVRLRKATCVVCAVQPAVTRAQHVRCVCGPPFVRYACATCADILDAQNFRCPICNGGAHR